MDANQISTKNSVTVFACVKLRKSGKGSCCASGARDVLVALRELVQQPGFEAVRIQPCSCLKKCKKGPAIVLFRNCRQADKKPSKKAWKKADARFKRLNPGDAGSVLKAAKDLLAS